MDWIHVSKEMHHLIKMEMKKFSNYFLLNVSFCFGRHQWHFEYKENIIEKNSHRKQFKLMRNQDFQWKKERTKKKNYRINLLAYSWCACFVVIVDRNVISIDGNGSRFIAINKQNVSLPLICYFQFPITSATFNSERKQEIVILHAASTQMD